MVELGAVIGIVYEAVAVVEAWPSALTAIADALNAGTVNAQTLRRHSASPGG
jgi:hypothetical protein